ncbi:HXXEE domain-containing protein [Jiulongibacter sp. NS-SX5]|uniref:HXXEE domain-containing protein n=1 Tax=Jiulongibacter sp. NS-SX5 TaxID=3463854 RepID=UPI004059A0A1
MNLYLLLPVAFLIYKFERLIGVERWIQNVPSFIHKPVKTSTYAVWIVFVGIASVLVFSLRHQYPSERAYLLLVTAFIGMLLISTCFPKVLSTFVLKKYTPGVITGAFLLVPLSIYMLNEIKETLGQFEIFFALLSGGFSGFIMTFFTQAFYQKFLNRRS